MAPSRDPGLSVVRLGTLPAVTVHGPIQASRLAARLRSVLKEIVVTTPTGNIGSRVVQLLSAGGGPAHALGSRSRTAGSSCARTGRRRPDGPGRLRRRCAGDSRRRRAVLARADDHRPRCRPGGLVRPARRDCGSRCNRKRHCPHRIYQQRRRGEGTGSGRSFTNWPAPRKPSAPPDPRSFTCAAVTSIPISISTSPRDGLVRMYYRPPSTITAAVGRLRVTSADIAAPRLLYGGWSGRNVQAVHGPGRSHPHPGGPDPHRGARPPDPRRDHLRGRPARFFSGRPPVSATSGRFARMVGTSAVMRRDFVPEDIRSIVTTRLTTLSCLGSCPPSPTAPGRIGTPDRDGARYHEPWASSAIPVATGHESAGQRTCQSPATSSQQPDSAARQSRYVVSIRDRNLACPERWTPGQGRRTAPPPGTPAASR